MAESFPVDGTGGFTTSDWANYFASSDGAVECYTADAFSLTMPSSGNTVGMNAGSQDAYFSVNGYRLRVPAGTQETFTAPNPTTGTVNYLLVAYYDPNLNVAAQDDSAPRPAGACRFQLLAASDAGTLLNGKPYVLMYSWNRSPNQALSTVAVTRWFAWHGPSMDWDPTATVPYGQSTFPRGTLRAQPTPGVLQVRTAVSASALGWVDLFNTGPFDFPLNSTYVSRYALPSKPQYLTFAGTMVKCRGAVKRSDGKVISSGNDATIGTMPVGYRPLFTERFIVKAGPGNNWVEVRVNGSGDGTVVMTGDGSGIEWIDLSALIWKREA